MKIWWMALMLGVTGCKAKVEKLPAELQAVADVVPRNIVIAHRGTTFWAPEETEAAMRWARNMGADYLELDLQRTKDSVLIALHDENLRRTTNVEEVFPERANAPVSAFTLEELRRLDAGSWFNEEFPERARKMFAGQDILTLEDVVNIAEGKRIVRDVEGKRVYRVEADGRRVTQYEPDPADNGNRPGIYPETKEPQLFPGMEADLARELTRLGWYDPKGKTLKSVGGKPGGVAVANSPARVILQTFSEESLAKLERAFPYRIPTCLLLWLGEGPSDLKANTPEAYAVKIEYGKKHGAVIIGPSIAGEPNNYDELLAPWQGEMIRQAGMLIHPYSFDTDEQMERYKNRADGMFTNQSDRTLRFYAPKDRPLRSAEQVLDEL